MLFDQIKGQNKAVELLMNSIKHNRIAQAYLFYGPEGVGKFTTALYFGMALNCLAANNKVPCGICSSCHKFLEFSHSDFIYIFPTPSLKTKENGELDTKAVNLYLQYIENRKTQPWEQVFFEKNTEIRMNDIELLQKHLELNLREGRYRICIVENAEQMNQNAANSFLKTLEEPIDNTVIILTTTNKQALYPTIVSRCQPVFFKPLSDKDIEEILIEKHLANKQSARSCAKMAKGNFELAMRYLQDTENPARAIMLKIIDAVLNNDDLVLIEHILPDKEKLKKDLLHDILSQTELWIFDLENLDSNLQDVINEDQSRLLNQSHARRNTNFTFDTMIKKLDELHNMIDGNVNPQFIIIAYYNYLKAFYI